MKQKEGLLIIGDALVGGRADLGVLDGEIGIHPNRFHMKHLTDIQKARRSLTQLMEYPFDAVCFGHGSPILYQAKAALRRFIDRLSSKPSAYVKQVSDINVDENCNCNNPRRPIWGFEETG